MKEEILFTEKQRFNQWWAWAILFVVNATSLYLIYTWVIAVEAFTVSSKSIGAIILLLIGLVLTFLFKSFVLITNVASEGISIQFKPIEARGKLIRWEDINHCYFRNYKPLHEYGGWGIRNGKGGMAYTIHGNIGLQLKLKNGFSLLIGTNQIELFSDILLTKGILLEDRVMSSILPD